MKVRLFTAIAIIAMAMISCSEDTEGIGYSITEESDKRIFNTGFYTATTKSIMADSVYARTNSTYLGKVKDPETNAYIKTEFMTQLNMLEGFSLPSKSKIVSTEDGDVVADSCELLVYFNHTKSYGDTLTAMKMRVTELGKPVEEPIDHYSNTDLKKGGFLRQGGIEKNMMFSMRDETISDSIRKLINDNLSLQGTSNDAGYYDYVSVKLNDPYTDQDGNTYKNYGTYLMRRYYENPDYFSNSYRFIHQICPGFYFEPTDGLGVMAYINNLQLKGHYRYTSNDSTLKSSFLMASTSEILQTTKVTNDREALQRLVDDESCTYLKTPAGIFTEVTLPVDEITTTHANDSLLSVSIDFERMNSNLDDVNYKFQIPDYVLLLQKDSLYSFFEQEKNYDNKIAYLSNIATSNAYSFSNIGNLITIMNQNKVNGMKNDPSWVANHPDWNKAVLVPVSVTASSSGTTGTAVSAVSNQMSLASTKLVGGKGVTTKVKVIYAKFKDR